jgi:ferric enterobactin receptor
VSRSTLVVAALALSLAAVSPLAAQAPAGPPAAGQAQPAFEIRGKVVDEKEQQPVPRASVTLRVKGSPGVLTGAIAGPDGSFRLQGLRPGTYTLRSTYIGFAPHIQEITLTPATPVVTGTVKLARVAQELSAVAVTEERTTVVTEPDRTTYRAKDVAPAAGNASEVLDNVPAVQVDGDGKVSLRGNENVAVQINGRPTPMRGPQLASYLKTVPANTIERVEVVPNPSAKYDPEGMAGIINIVLKQNVDLGLSTGLNTAMSTPERFFGNGNLGYQAGKISSMTTAGFNRDARAIVGINDRERYDAARTLLSMNGEDIDSEAKNAGLNVTSSLDYQINKRDMWSNGITGNKRWSTDESLNLFTERDGAGAVTDSYFRPRDADVKGWMLDYNTAFRRTFEARPASKHELSVEARINRSQDNDEQLLRRTSLGATPTSTDWEHQLTDAQSQQLNAQLDYVRTLRPRVKVEMGYKGTARTLDREFNVTEDPTGSGTWTPSAQSNAFSFDENVHAVYGLYSYGIRKWDLQAGLRGEYATRDFQLAAQNYPYEYASVYPSAIANYNATQTVQLKASYSRRVRRPGTQELNPFVTYFDVRNVFIGNPALAPEYTDALEFGYTKTLKKGTLQLNPFYRHTKDIIRVDINTVDTIAGREVTSISFQNLATSDSWGADLNGSLRLGPKLNGFAGFNVFKMVTDGGSTSAIGSDAVNWMGRVNASSELTKRFFVQGSYFYRAPMKIERGQFEAQHGANFALRGKMNDRANVTLRVNDPFGTQRFRVRAGDDYVMQITERNFQARMVWLAFNYSYGRPPRLRAPTQDQSQGSSTGFTPPSQ